MKKQQQQSGVKQKDIENHSRVVGFVADACARAGKSSVHTKEPSAKMFTVKNIYVHTSMYECRATAVKC